MVISGMFNFVVHDKGMIMYDGLEVLHRYRARIYLPTFVEPHIRNSKVWYFFVVPVKSYTSLMLEIFGENPK